MNLYKSITWHKTASLLLLISLMGSASCNRVGQETVLINTEKGEIVIEIYSDLAPVTASNFLSLVEQGVFTNSIFYRVVRLDNQPRNKVKIEVIQGGLFEDSLVNIYAPIIHETTEATGIRHTEGVISMARNEPGSASTEFFICIGDQPSLDFGGDRNPDGQGFSAFGRVIRGMEVVKTIQALPDQGQYLEEKVLIREIKLIP